MNLINKILWNLSLLLCLNVLCVKCDDQLQGISKDSEEEQKIPIYIISCALQATLIQTEIPLKFLKASEDLIPNYVRTNIMPIPQNPKIHNNRRIYYPKGDQSKPSVHEYHPAIETSTSNPALSFDMTTMTPTTSDGSAEKFSAKLYQIMAKSKDNDNLIYSPISIHSLLTLLYLGAKQRTAQQLQTALELPSSTTDITEKFQAIEKETRNQSTDFQLDIAQKIYFKNLYDLRNNFKSTAKNILNTEIEPISFESGVNAAREINRWVSEQTHDRIKDIVTADTLNADTQVVMVNALYLKAKWAKEFSTMDTLKQDFFIPNQADPISVDMMYIDDDFVNGDFPELDAKIVELPFLDSHLSMLIILPNQRDGLASMESKLKDVDFNQLLGRMGNSPVVLRLPKFKIESDLNMEEPLHMLGVHDIFTDNAMLDKMFSRSDVKVSEIKHKAFINVNEGGVEAAAASYIHIVPLSLQPNMVFFNVEHPFMFAIRSPQAVYFMGHVINNFQ